MCSAGQAVHVFQATPPGTCSAAACSIRRAVAGIPSSSQHASKTDQSRTNERQVPSRPHAVRCHPLRCQERIGIRISWGFDASGDHERATELVGRAVIPGRFGARFVQSPAVAHHYAAANVDPAAHDPFWCWHAPARVVRGSEGRTAAGRLLPGPRARHDASGRSYLEQRLLQYAFRRQRCCGIQHCLHAERSAHQVSARRIVASRAPSPLLSWHDVDRSSVCTSVEPSQLCIAASIRTSLEQRY